ncbi:MAG: ABC transporter ATP-binding protein [Planctomycetia bacterium]|nr:ABC transporter ATP-binding protein [Planctomycetia bacterium]
MLNVKNLSFNYGAKRILSNLSFEIEPESITALLGPNGSGKTTLLRCLDLFLRAQEGQICLDGVPITRLSANAIARSIAYMPQRCELTGMTVFDSVLLGRKPYLAWHPEEKDYALVEKTLKRLDLLDKSLQTLDRLSGGELQKVVLGRIFVQEPRLILLDEPMSSLDLKNRVEIMRHLTHFVHRTQAAVLMSIHDLNDAFRLADRLLFLKNGTLYADQTPQNTTGGILSDVYDMPLEVVDCKGAKIVIPGSDSTQGMARQ